jgi:hypothetical protein
VTVVHLALVVCSPSDYTPHVQTRSLHSLCYRNLARFSFLARCVTRRSDGRQRCILHLIQMQNLYSFGLAAMSAALFAIQCRSRLDGMHRKVGYGEAAACARTAGPWTRRAMRLVYLAELLYVRAKIAMIEAWVAGRCTYPQILLPPFVRLSRHSVRA